MDITRFVVQGREQALTYGDYATYHARLAQRLLNCRKKLGLATKNRGKFQKKGDVTSADIASKKEYVHLLLLTSERAWAQAMSYKTARASDKSGIRAQTRSHIVSRLQKAARSARNLVDCLSDLDASGASSTDLLEAKAYAALISGGKNFEKQTWKSCLECFASARIIYSALVVALQSDIFRDLLSENIDPSIRYAAYRLDIPRTTPIPTIAKDFFPQSDKTLADEINAIDSNILKEGDADPTKGVTGAGAIPRTLTWRSREVKIEDAQIASTWAAVQKSIASLSETLASSKGRSPYDTAGAYDEVLMLTQDAVDATKQAMDELRSEGVATGDTRMQSLQITRTAVNFEMVSWRVGRNRVLTGPHDGAPEGYRSIRKARKNKDDEASMDADEVDLPASKKLAKLKEKVALYDGTLQNLEQIRELPGVAADEQLAAKLDAFEKYFQALKCLSIGRSHAIVGKVANALALIHHAYGLCQEASSQLPKDLASTDDDAPLNVEVTPRSISSLSKLLDGELQRHRAMVHLEKLRKEDVARLADLASARPPLIEHMDEFPPGGVDLNNIVEYPPKMALIPVKPMILDVAWNYIEYPGRTPQAQPAGAAAAPSTKGQEPGQQTKRGWFGFGRG